MDSLPTHPGLLILLGLIVFSASVFIYATSFPSWITIITAVAGVLLIGVDVAHLISH